MTQRRAGRPAPAAAALYEVGNAARQGVVSRGKQQLRPFKAIDATRNNGTIMLTPSAPLSGLGVREQPRVTETVHDAQAQTARTNATSINMVSATATTGSMSEKRQKERSAVPGKHVCTRNVASRLNTQQTQESPTRNDVPGHSGANGVAGATLRSRTMADPPNGGDRVTAEIVGVSASRIANVDDSFSKTRRKRKSSTEHGLEDRKKRPAPRRGGVADVTTCATQRISLAHESTGTPSPEGEAIYRSVCKLQEELEEKVKPFQETSKQKRVEKTLRSELKNKSHYIEVQKLLRQKCSPSKKTGTTAADIPWVESPVDTDEEPTVANSKARVKEAVHSDQHPTHNVSMDASRWSMCETAAQDKHTYTYSIGKSQHREEGEGLHQQIHQLTESNTKLSSRCADLEVRLAEQQEALWKASHKASRTCDRAMHALHQDFDRFAEKLEGLLRDFKSLRDSVKES